MQHRRMRALQSRPYTCDEDAVQTKQHGAMSQAACCAARPEEEGEETLDERDQLFRDVWPRRSTPPRFAGQVMIRRCTPDAQRRRSRELSRETPRGLVEGRDALQETRGATLLAGQVVLREVATTERTLTKLPTRNCSRWRHCRARV